MVRHSQAACYLVLYFQVIRSPQNLWKSHCTGLQDATFGVLSVLPRACWITFLVLMLVWITHTQGGFNWAKTAMGSQGLLNLHFIFMTVAWPICMFEAIFSYRMPVYKLPHRK